MIVYVDTSVLLRKLFGEPRQLREWPRVKQAYASRLLRLEVGRVIDRFRLLGRVGDAEVVVLQQELRRLLRSIDSVAMGEAILERAAGPMPTVLGTLDAVHLTTALEIRRRLAPDLVFATHDEQLARGARASGLEVVGC